MPKYFLLKVFLILAPTLLLLLLLMGNPSRLDVQSIVGLVAAIAGVIISVWFTEGLNRWLYQLMERLKTSDILIPYAKQVALAYEVVRRITSWWAGRDQQLYANLSIVGIMQKRRTGQTVQSTVVLSMSLLGYIAYCILTSASSNSLVLLILIFVLILLWVDKAVFDYRIGNGLYGNNEREAREIIWFIIRESSNIDFTSGGRPRRIIGDADLESMRQIGTTVTSTTGAAE